MINDNKVTKIVEDLTHISREDLKPLEIHSPDEIPLSAQPTPEFIEAVNRIESQKKAPIVSPPQNQPSTVTTVAPQPQIIPLKLSYTYSGTCEMGHSVETLVMEVGKSLFAVAYCAICKKKIMDQKVPPLEGGA